MIIFKGFYAEGFGSMVKPTKFTLDRPGLNVIRGVVGSGKTNIPSVLSWCLFGQSLKYKSQIATWEEKRPKDFKGTIATVNFIKDNIEYEISRCLDYKKKVKVGDRKMKGGNNIFITIDGKPYTQARNKKDKQNTIEDILGYSFDLFKSSIVFGQKMKKIIEESGPQKKKIFEEAFEVGFIEEAKDETKTELDKLRVAYNDIDSDIDNIKERISDKKIFYEEAKQTENNFEENKLEEIRELQEELNGYKKEKAKLKKKSKLPKGLADSKELEDKIEELEDKLEDANSNNYKFNRLKESIKTLEDSIKENKKTSKKETKICPTCKGVMNAQAIKEYNKELKAKKEKLHKELKQKRESISYIKFTDVKDIKEKIHQLRQDLKVVEGHKTKAKLNKKRLPEVKQRINKTLKKITKLENSKLLVKSTKYKKQIKKLEKELDTLKNNLESLDKQINIKDWLIKDPLSNNGLKAYMFHSLLTQVNDALEDYSKILGFQVEFGIDLDTHRKDFYQIIYYQGVISPYEDLSGGQKQLVDTAIAFAIHDVISTIRPTNILFLDEPFESLGVNEIEIIEELVEKKAQNKALYLITHHESFTPRNANDIVVTRGDDGISKIS